MFEINYSRIICSVELIYYNIDSKLNIKFKGIS